MSGRTYPLSIVTVCRNEAPGIRRTAESILSQSDQNFEWIVMDGGSTDGTIDILQEYQSRMNHFTTGPDGGIYEAMNKGIRCAVGDYILFLNGGDALHSADVLQRVAQSLHHADVVYGQVNILGADGQFQKTGTIEQGLISGAHFFASKNLPHQASFIKRSLFLRFGEYDTQYRIIADRVFFSKLAMAGCSFKAVPLIVSNFVLGGLSSHPNSQDRIMAELEKWRATCFPVRYRCMCMKRQGIRSFHRISTALADSVVGVAMRRMLGRPVR